MDLSLSPEEQTFAADIRGWLEANLELPPPFASLAEEVEWGRAWQAKLARDRWIAIHWPAEFGGRGASPVQVAIFNMEYARSRALQPVNRNGINLAGPTLLAHGARGTNLAEVGVGTNDRARMTGNVLEDEKILGTVHVAFGASAGIGGTVSVPIHLDVVTCLANACRSSSFGDPESGYSPLRRADKKDTKPSPRTLQEENSSPGSLSARRTSNPPTQARQMASRW